jgi:hypothetical protein
MMDAAASAEALACRMIPYLRESTMRLEVSVVRRLAKTRELALRQFEAKTSRQTSADMPLPCAGVPRRSR